MIVASNRRRRLVPPWNITNLNLIRDYDPDDLAAGSLPSWPAHTGIGPTLTAVAAPMVVASVLNGHNVVRFDDALSECLVASSGGTAINGLTGYTLIAVYKSTTTAANVAYHMGSDSLRLTSTGGGAHLLVVDETSGAYGTTPALGDNAWVRQIWRFDGTQSGNAARLRCRANGVDRTLSISGTVPATITAGPDTVIGRYSSGGYYFRGDLALLALTSDCLNDADTDAADAWVVDRFGL